MVLVAVATAFAKEGANGSDSVLERTRRCLKQTKQMVEEQGRVQKRSRETLVTKVLSAGCTSSG